MRDDFKYATGKMYHHMQERFFPPKHKGIKLIYKSKLPFTLEELRVWVKDEFERWNLNGLMHCYYCNELISILTCSPDHRVPVSRNGSLNLDNLELLCKPCNIRKGKLTDTEYAELCELVKGWDDTGRRDLTGRLSTAVRMSYARIGKR